MPFHFLDQESVRFRDDRGHLEVLFESPSLVLKRSFSRAGVFRGLHRQDAAHAQTKLIRVVSGRIMDFIVDPDEPAPVIRARPLQPADGWVLIEARFAHGFYALEDCTFEYICEGGYAEGSESSYSIARQLQAVLGITAPTLSAKDAAATPLDFPLEVASN
jgi:dTDP-4-dehydrorhamnose 3,5-epimerase